MFWKLPKPDWIRVKVTHNKTYEETKSLLDTHKLTTVCSEAACPNIGECWSQRHATVMIMGDICTRACAFCNVATGKPQILDEEEPQKIANLTKKMGLRHIVITSVDRGLNA